MSEISQPILTTYDVTITATITKTYRVEAENADKAVEEANHYFSVIPDGTDEYYDQQTDSVREVDEVEYD